MLLNLYQQAMIQCRYSNEEEAIVYLKAANNDVFGNETYLSHIRSKSQFLIDKNRSKLNSCTVMVFMS